MKLKAKNLSTGKQLEAWTTESDKNAALSIIVPFRDEYGNLTYYEVGMDRASLLRAFKAGSLEARQ